MFVMQKQWKTQTKPELFQHLCCSESDDSAVLITPLSPIAIDYKDFFFCNHNLIHKYAQAQAYHMKACTIIQHSINSFSISNTYHILSTSTLASRLPFASMLMQLHEWESASLSFTCIFLTRKAQHRMIFLTRVLFSTLSQIFSDLQRSYWTFISGAAKWGHEQYPI